MSLCSFFYAYSVNLHNIPYLCPHLKEQHMKKVDKLDLKILQIISLDARVPFKDVAEVCGVSRAAIHQRVSRLCEAGVITGSGYTVNAKHIGYSTCTYVAELVKIPEIVECHYTTGNYTMLIKLFSRDNEHLMELLNNRIQEIPGVVSTETLISLEESFSRQVPIIVPTADTDDDMKAALDFAEELRGKVRDDMDETVSVPETKRRGRAAKSE